MSKDNSNHTKRQLAHSFKFCKKKLNINNNTISAKAKVSNTRLVEISQARGNCQIDTLIKIAEAMNCELLIKFVPPPTGNE